MGYQEQIGFINIKGEEVISPKYKSATNFENGIALVSADNHKWGAINKQGQIIIPLKYEQSQIYREKDKISINNDTNKV